MLPRFLAPPKSLKLTTPNPLAPGKTMTALVRPASVWLCNSPRVEFGMTIEKIKAAYEARPF
jgi:hypothetical protein